MNTQEFFERKSPYEISQDIFIFPGHQGRWGRGGTSSVIFLNSNDKPTIIDSSTKINRQRIINMTKKTSIDFNKIKRIIHTHEHGDHCLGDPVFRKKNPEIIIEAHEKASPWIEKLPDYFKNQVPYLLVPYHEAYMAPQWFFEAYSNFYFGKADYISINQQFKDEFHWKFNEFTLKTLFTPGHSPGHCSFYIPERKILFLGDIIDPRKDAKPVMPHPSSNFALLRKSLLKLKTIDVEVMVPSHGSLVRGKKRITALLNRCLQHLNLFDTVMCKELQKGPKTLARLANILVDSKMVPFENERRMMTHSVLRSAYIEQKITLIIKKRKSLKKQIFFALT